MLAIERTQTAPHVNASCYPLTYLRFAELVDKQCGAGFSLRGTSVPLEERAGTCGRRAEAPPQAEACPTFCHRLLRTSLPFDQFVFPQLRQREFRIIAAAGN